MESASAFPPPPVYYKLFSNSNKQTEHGKSLSIPPIPPGDNEPYQHFGQEYKFSDLYAQRHLSDANVKSLFKERVPDPFDSTLSSLKAKIEELRKLNRSLRFHIFELFQILSKYPNLRVIPGEGNNDFSMFEDPSKSAFIASENEEKFLWELKIRQIELIFLNIAFLLNSNRRHQAFEKLTTILSQQVARKKEIRENLTKTLLECKDELSAVCKEEEDAIVEESKRKRKREGEEQEEEQEKSEETKKKRALDDISQESSSSYDIISIPKDVLNEFFLN